MGMQLVTVMRLECSVCAHLVCAEGSEIRDKLLDKNDPTTVLCLLVQMGHCPLCGTCTGAGQTSDDIIERYNNFLKSA
jgi:hypothetical protein